MAETGKKHILVAEDDRAYAHIYEVKLTQEGFDVTIAADGEQALVAAKKHRPDLILLDLIMPGKDGFETLHDLKKDPNLASIPVIAFSNLGQDEDIERTKKLGVADYLIKTNLSVHEMVEKVKEHLKD